jgi:para-nitrobenzyl esterase
VYLYNFNRKLPYYSEESNFGAFHSAEIVYAYNNLQTLDRPWESYDKNLASIMSDYWSNFAKSGNPNGSGLPKWEQFDYQKPMVIIFDKGTLSIDLPTIKQLSFWEKYMSK